MWYHTSVVSERLGSIAFAAASYLCGSCKGSANSFPCHTSASFARNSFVCHSSKTKDLKSFTCHAPAKNVPDHPIMVNQEQS
jgi:hypothetical protein